MFAPHPKQRDAVVNFGALPQPSAALAAASRLQPPQEPGVVARHVPKSPRDHTGAVPGRIHVGAATPQIDMPTEAIDRLAAHAAESRTLRVYAFAIGRGWRSICGGQPMLAIIAELPSPAAGAPLRVASARASRSARIGWARQYESTASRGVGGTKGRPSAQDRTAGGKRLGNALLRRASD